MRPILKHALSAGLLAIPLLAGAPPALAAGPNVLVLGEDADPDSLARDSSVFRRVRDSMASELHEAGYTVYDETALALALPAAGRIGQDDAALIAAARAARQPPVDVLAIVAVYAAAVDSGYVTRLQARVSGRLLQVGSERRLGSFEVASGDGWRIGADCARDRDCLLEAVGAKARLIGRDVAVALREKLDRLYPAEGPAMVAEETAPAKPGEDCLPAGYSLTFDGFETADILDFEEYLAVFSGYREHRPVASAVKHHEYWYSACISAARLKRNLTRMLEHLSLKALLRQSGHTFVLQKLTVRRGDKG